MALRSFARCICSQLNTTHFSSSQLFFSRPLSSELFIKGLSFSTTEEGLTKTFSDFGEVVQARIIRHKASNKSKGYGFVTFATDDAAQQALMVMNGKILDGRVLSVDKELRGAKLDDGKKVQRKETVQRESTVSPT